MLKYFLAVLAACANATSSVLWGVLVFGERVRTGWFAVLAGLSAVVLAVALFVLIRSPLLSDEAADQEGQPAGQQSTAHSTRH